ncbi:hypothetical protein [Acinetobacter puyangensis]|uniref:hypothetical protein n=1 Tax=Acinetobacter puyangensis TaxID=1096779 RepID=UPI003A4D4271
MLTIGFFITYIIGIATCFNKARLSWIANKNGCGIAYFSIIGSFSMGFIGIIALIKQFMDAGVL